MDVGAVPSVRAGGRTLIRRHVTQVKADGPDPRGRPTADDTLDDQDGRLIVPATGHPLTDDEVRELRDADQR